MSRLNCKPGDLARVISPGHWSKCSCGARVCIVQPDTIVACGPAYADGWKLQDPIPVNVVLPCGQTSVVGSLKSLPDAILRPIRDPGDDAVDEMVKLVGIAPMTAAEVLAWSEVSHG